MSRDDDDAPALADADVDRLRASVTTQSAEDTFSGRFEIVAEAGHGGMGRVYEAIDSETGGRVAIKVITGLASPADRARFASEAEALERLDHPAIVDYVRHGVTTRGEPYLAMEWLVGESLAYRLWRGPLTVAEAAILGERLADALAHAHGAGIVHRDLKPSNILLVDCDVAQAHLIDFGVAKLDDRDLTRTGQLIGTPGYMAPEQVRGEKSVNQSVDLFALGCVLYEALTGGAPFRGSEVMEVLARLLLEEPAPIETVAAGVPPRLAHLIGALLAKDAADRLGDARVACSELAAVRAGLAAQDETALALQPGTVPASPRKPDGTTERPTRALAGAARDEPAARPHPRRRWRIAALGAGVVIAAVVTVLALRSSGAPACDDDHRAGCEAACRAGDAAACFRRARALHGGLGGISVDHEAGRITDARGCDLGWADCCYEGGSSLIAVVARDKLPGGRPPAEDPRRAPRLAEAARLLQRGCDLGAMIACRRLGREYSDGFGALAPDATRAFALVERACTGDDVAACKALRDMIDSRAGTDDLRAGAALVLDAACRRNLLPC